MMNQRTMRPVAALTAAAMLGGCAGQMNVPLGGIFNKDTVRERPIMGAVAVTGPNGAVYKITAENDNGICDVSASRMYSGSSNTVALIGVGGKLNTTYSTPPVWVVKAAARYSDQIQKLKTLQCGNEPAAGNIWQAVQKGAALKSARRENNIIDDGIEIGAGLAVLGAVAAIVTHLR